LLLGVWQFKHSQCPVFVIIAFFSITIQPSFKVQGMCYFNLTSVSWSTNCGKNPLKDVDSSVHKDAMW
jgi:hypothetical protein